MSDESPPLFVQAGRQAQSDSRPQLATLLGADFSARSITPSHGDQAPNVVRSALNRFATWDAHEHVDLAQWNVHDIGDSGAIRMTWDSAFEAIRHLADRAWDMGKFVVALGGDHSVSWPLIAAATGHAARTGIIQLDVHHDVRELDHGASNGTPIRGLIEQGLVRSSDIVQIGIHPFGNKRAYTDYCDSQGITRYSLSDVNELGPVSIATAAHQKLASCDRIYLTVDIDVLDRAFAPGTVAALPGGLTPRELMLLVTNICDDARVMAMDVVEFDPSRDVSDITAYNVALTVVTALSAVARRATGIQRTDDVVGGWRTS
ncbi:MAG: agmatinase family protein [Thermoleophilia bacterium]|nr:agmatinase family protein [Thermoleophilia bacterium]